VGQTIPKNQIQLEKGLGKVIICDIHQLATGGYSSEALNALTLFVRAYSGIMAIVLTWPSEPVDELLADRHELGSMFPDRITFQDLSPRDCLNLLDRKIRALEPSAETPFFTPQAAAERFEKAMSILLVFEDRGNSPLIANQVSHAEGGHQLLLAGVTGLRPQSGSGLRAQTTAPMEAGLRLYSCAPRSSCIYS